MDFLDVKEPKMEERHFIFNLLFNHSASKQKKSIEIIGQKAS
ncbi:hypothetical protein [Heyndrickxia oleronia]|nr:hypothetical protein [Heyndrickxia oleronia]